MPSKGGCKKSIFDYKMYISYLSSFYPENILSEKDQPSEGQRRLVACQEQVLYDSLMYNTYTLT